jgi:hypothetical protein
MPIDASQMDRYIDGKLVKEGKKDELGGKEINFQWWKATDEELAGQVTGTVRFIQTHQSSRIEQLTVATRLYGNTSAFGLIGTAFTRAANVSSNPSSQRIGFNLVASVVDTRTSQIAKNKVIPIFITNGGDWEIQQKAEQLSKFVEGCFYQTEMHRKGTYAYRDGGVWGDGIVKIYRKGEEICVDRVLPHEIIVDLVESLCTEPTQLHQVRIVDRSVLLSQFPDEEDQEAIRTAGGATPQEIGGAGTAADLVTVIESWHLPSENKPDVETTDGRHALIVGDKKLVNEPYTKKYFPFAKYSYCKRLLGWWGQGAAERLQNIQGEINRLMILIQRSMWMGGSFKVLVKIGSKVVSQHINNDVGAIINYAGDTPPQYVTPPMIQQDIYPYIDSLIAKGYRQEGVSELEAASVKPQGVDSGKALRTIADIAAVRQEFQEQEMERMYLESAKQMIEVAKDIYKEKGSFKVLFSSTKFVEQIDWKDINLDETQYVMKAFPMSSLADDLTGRIQDVTEMMQAGLISPRTGRRLLRKPDVEMADALASAAEDLLCRRFEDMLRKGEYRPPEPYNDLQLAREIGLEYYNYADFHNAPNDKLELVRKFLKGVDDLTGVGQPPPLEATASAQVQAVPTAPPVSQLLPNGPQAMAQGGPVVDDATAVMWAHANPGHPASKTIKAIHGVS